MATAHHDVTDKVAAIFRELAGERSRRLDAGLAAVEATRKIARAFRREYGADKAHEIAFHIADWNGDAAFVVALHLFPERFSAEEVRAGIGMFLVHAPNHIRAACGLTGQYVWSDFPSGGKGDPSTRTGMKQVVRKMNRRK